MKNAIIVLWTVFFFTSTSCLGQGGWDIGFLSLDSISRQDIGRDVKIDFRRASDTSNAASKSFDRIGAEDTVIIQMGAEVLTFIEQRIIHADWGFYDEQYLESANAANNKVIRVYHSVIEDVKADSILVRLYIEQYKRLRRGKVGTIVRRRTETVWIEKKLIERFMIKM